MIWEQRKNRSRNPGFPRSLKNKAMMPSSGTIAPRVMMLLTEVTGSFSDQLLAQKSVVLSSCDQDKIAST